MAENNKESSEDGKQFILVVVSIVTAFFIPLIQPSPILSCLFIVLIIFLAIYVVYKKVPLWTALVYLAILSFIILIISVYRPPLPVVKDYYYPTSTPSPAPTNTPTLSSTPTPTFTPSLTPSVTSTPTRVPLGVVEYLIDLSFSMGKKKDATGTTYFEAVKQVFYKPVNEIDFLDDPYFAVGLRTFGNTKVNCTQPTPTYTAPALVSPHLGAGSEIARQILDLKPNPVSGTSEILLAIDAAVHDVSEVPAASGESRKLIVFTDGDEECYATPTEQTSWRDNTYRTQVDGIEKLRGIHIRTYLLVLSNQNWKPDWKPELCKNVELEDKLKCEPVRPENLASKLEIIKREEVLIPSPTLFATFTVTAIPSSTPAFTPTQIPLSTSTPALTPAPPLNSTSSGEFLFLLLLGVIFPAVIVALILILLIVGVTAVVGNNSED